jgi:ESCRT-I complex subunit TSG101
MLVRPGQHVGVEGRVYHPYLRDWSGMWDRANIADFLNYLQQVFAREPPLVSKAQQQLLQRPVGQQQPANGSPAPPQLPPKQRAGNDIPAEMPSTNTPPPRPPKPGEDNVSKGAPRNYASDGPPLPPLPGGISQVTQYASSANGFASNPQYRPNPAAQTASFAGHTPLPALPQHVQYQQHRASNDGSPVSPISPPHAPHAQGNRHSYAAPVVGYQQTQTQPYPHDRRPQHQGFMQAPPQFNQQQTQYTQQRPQAHQLHQSQQKKQPPPDLLSDPFEVALPSGPGAGVPAPPIPPNPEKEHLLQAISTSLVQQAQQKVQQNMSAIAPLQAQQQALRAAYARLENERSQLEKLDATLSSNESILHRSIQDCNHVISEAKSKKQPPIDEVLVAPTLVAQQLWTLTAEEAACREAMYVLQKAVDRGRISGNDFVRQMRGLGRESFLKMVLARKCARGLGLEVDR